MAKSKRSLKPIPRFASEAEERHFWETHDSAGYVDWSKATVCVATESEAVDRNDLVAVYRPRCLVI